MCLLDHPTTEDKSGQKTQPAEQRVESKSAELGAETQKTEDSANNQKTTD
jgi:hypothetical protein